MTDRDGKILASCDPAFRTLFTEVEKYIKIAVTCGARTRDEQNRLFAEGKTKLTGDDPRAKHVTGGYSNGKIIRTLSDAIDVVPLQATAPIIMYPDTVAARILRKPTASDLLIYGKLWAEFAMMAQTFIVIAKSMSINLRWGGDWDGDYDLSDNVFNDLPHIEIVRR